MNLIKQVIMMRVIASLCRVAAQAAELKAANRAVALQAMQRAAAGDQAAGHSPSQYAPSTAGECPCAHL